jgi:spermidine synthase
LYARHPASRAATVRGLVATCLVEALVLAIPLALGDRVAFAASALRGTSVLGFAGQVAGWAAICAIVVLPAAIAAGVQFPLLVNLVGRGRDGVGRDLGAVYAANTGGAIAGALLGGFVLLPALGAVGCWRLAIVVLVALGVAASVVGVRAASRWALAASGVAAGLAIALVMARGPTAAWRHSGIGAGRAVAFSTPASAHSFASRARRILKWEREGVESSVALIAEDGYAFVVNGKVDGGALGDAATQMMGGLVGAAIHPHPRRALVIGLGTGETAGWLAAMPGMERVDVVELEPAIVEIAARCAPVNRDVLENPKVHLHIGDARELLLVDDDRYDLIFSEPSNPYRAGVAGLYTREFYAAARARLDDGGLFLQWTQSYEVDGATLATIYATLAAEFSALHTWRLERTDLMFVASASPIHYDAARLAASAAAPAFRDALAYAWDVEGVEGLLSHYIGGDRLAREVASRAGELNTDDRTLIEFAFARTLGQHNLANILPLRELAIGLRDDRPDVTVRAEQLAGNVDWSRFAELRAFADALAGFPPRLSGAFTGDALPRVGARAAYAGGDAAAAIAAWRRQPAEPASHFERLLRAEGLATLGDDAALADVAGLRAAEVAIVRARLRERQKRIPEATAAIADAFVAMRGDPFVDRAIAHRALTIARDIAGAARDRVPSLLDALAEPFALYLAEEDRITAILGLTQLADPAALVRALAPLEPNVPWTLELLVRRRAAYEATGNPLFARADADLEELLAGQATAIVPAATGAGDRSAE